MSELTDIENIAVNPVDSIDTTEPIELKKIHWTQLPENKEKLRKLRIQGMKTRSKNLKKKSVKKVKPVVISGKSLLELAKSLPTKEVRKNDITQQEIELILAWLRDEVNLNQIGKVLKLNTGNIYSRLCITLRQAYRLKYIKIV